MSHIYNDVVYVIGKNRKVGTGTTGHKSIIKQAFIRTTSEKSVYLNNFGKYSKKK